MTPTQDRVADLIKRCKFNKTEIHTATNGECMWFAMALHNIVTEHGINASFAVATAEMNSWCHVLVRQGRGFYDIQGKVLAKFVHNQFESRRMIRVERDELFDAYSCRTKDAAKIIRKWQRRLNAETT